MASSQQTFVIQQQPMVTVHSDPSVSNATTRSRGTWKGLRITGYMQVILGVISTLFGILAIVFKTYVYFVGYAVWMGICFYIVAGILGIASGGKQRKGLVAGYLIMSIIAAVCACCMITLAGVNIGNDRYICPDWLYFHYDYDVQRQIGCSTSEGTRVAIDALVLVVGIAELAVAIVGASFTCSSLCCNSRPSYPMVFYQSAPQGMVPSQAAVQYAVVPQQQFVQQPQFGNVVYGGQPIMVAPAQPLPQPQGQVQYQTPPQGVAPAQGVAPPYGQAQAEAPPYEPADASRAANLPGDNHSKPLIT